MLMLPAVIAQAQYNTLKNNVWPFGRYGGLSFASGSPEAIITGIIGPEGTAGVSDGEGNLLFYTEGQVVWDRTHNVMSGGGTISPYMCASSIQSSAIAPVLNYPAGHVPNQYYIFSVTSYEYMMAHPEDTGGMRLYYSLVDMSLNGGLGGVVPGATGICLATRMCEKIITIPGANCDVWVLVHRIEEPVLYAFHITACGLDPNPVVSVAGFGSGPLAYLAGVMKSAPNARRIVVCGGSTLFTPGDTTFVGAELLDFDPATGIVSNALPLAVGSRALFAEFSPDNSKVYTTSRLLTTGDSSTVIQYDVTDTATIQASMKRVYALHGPGVRDMRLGPDGKIYACKGSLVNSIDCIAAPNAVGVAANYQPDILTALPGSGFYFGLTNLYNEPLTLPVDSVITVSDTTVCFTDADTVLLTAPFPGCVRWYNGDMAAVKAVTGAGQYSVTSASGCARYRHTFNVAAAALPCAAGLAVASVASGIKIYPLPAASECTIESMQPLPQGTKALLYDVTGRLAGSFALAPYKTTIPLAGIAAGVYVVRILVEGTATTAKLTVVK